MAVRKIKKKVLYGRVTEKELSPMKIFAVFFKISSICHSETESWKISSALI